MTFKIFYNSHIILPTIVVCMVPLRLCEKGRYKFLLIISYCRTCPVCCASARHQVLAWGQSVYFEKIRVLKAGIFI